MTLVLEDLRPEAAERAKVALAKGEKVVFEASDKPGHLLIGLFRDEPGLIRDIAHEAREARDREAGIDRE